MSWLPRGIFQETWAVFKELVLYNPMMTGDVLRNYPRPNHWTENLSWQKTLISGQPEIPATSVSFELSVYQKSES